MPYLLVLERASGTHKHSVQQALGLLTSTCSVVCLFPQVHSNKLRLAALEVPGFIFLWCLGAQRKGMVISMDIQIRIAQIDKEFKDILNSVTAENQQSLLTDPRIGELMSEKRILENRLAECAAAEQKRADTESRLTNLYTILEGMKNHPMEYDDRLIRKILRCVVVQTKQRIKVVFIDGLEMEVEVEQ